MEPGDPGGGGGIGALGDQVKIGYFLSRQTHLKVLGPVAAEARRRGHACVAQIQRAGPKDDVSKSWAQGLSLFDQVTTHDLEADWMVAVGLRTAADERHVSRSRGIKWAALDSCGDNLLYVREYGEAVLKDWDCVTTLAPEPRDAAGAWMLEPVGYPELDQLFTVISDQAACRVKWNLPERQNIVLFAPAARPAHLSRLSRWWWGRGDYPFIAHQVRRFCDRHGALLITKTRAKHGDPPWLEGLSDRYIGETCYYPFDTLELVVASDLVTGGFGSALAIEAAAVGRPQAWLQAWPLERSEWPRFLPVRRPFFADPGGLWNHAGARTLNCYGPRWREHLQFWAEESPWPELDDAAREQHSRAVTRWAGPVDGKASARFLDLLESRC